MIRHFATVRVVTTGVATAGVVVAGVIGATALVATLRHTLISDLEDASRTQALEIVRVLESGQLPNFQMPGGDVELIQVMTPEGAVVASSPNVAGKPAVARLAPGQSAQVITPLDNEAFIAVAEGAHTRDGLRVVMVAKALVDAFDVSDRLTQLLIIGLPVSPIIVAFTTWVMVGRRSRR